MGRFRIKKSMIYLILAILTLLSIVPFWIMMINATRSTEQIQQSLAIFPGKQLKYNWDVLTGRGFNVFNGFINSFIIATCSTVLSIYFSSLTAYGLVAYNFKGKKLIFALIVGIIMIPGQLSLIGFYQFLLRIGLTDSFIPLIVPAIAAPGTVFFMRQYLVATLSPELSQAARIDGAGEVRIFHNIILPIMKPALATMAIFAFVASWNNFMTPLILLSSERRFTLPMMVQMLRADIYRTEFGGIYLGISLTILPLLVVYLILSKYIIRGVALGGLKE